MQLELQLLFLLHFLFHFQTQPNSYPPFSYPESIVPDMDDSSPFSPYRSDGKLVTQHPLYAV